MHALLHFYMSETVIHLQHFINFSIIMFQGFRLQEQNIYVSALLLFLISLFISDLPEVSAELLAILLNWLYAGTICSLFSMFYDVPILTLHVWFVFLHVCLHYIPLKCKFFSHMVICMYVCIQICACLYARTCMFWLYIFVQIKCVSLFESVCMHTCMSMEGVSNMYF